jgi:hypothetical protein
LAFRALARGEFKDALSWSERGKKILPHNANVKAIHHDTLLANGAYDRLLAELETERLAPGQRLNILLQIMRIAAIKGDEAQAKAALEEAFQLVPAQNPKRAAYRTDWEMTIQACKQDTEGYLKLVASHPDRASFESALLQNKLDEAAGKIAAQDPNAPMQHALLFLSASQSKEPKQADAHWQAFIEALGKGDKEERKAADILSGRKPFDAEVLCRILIKAEHKRVLLAAAAKRFPMDSEQLLALSRKLDFHHDAVSLCLKKLGN